MTINKDMAYKCGEALVLDYNNKYDTLSLSCRKVSFRTLYEDLKKLNCKWLIASAKGDDEVRKYGFRK